MARLNGMGRPTQAMLAASLVLSLQIGCVRRVPEAAVQTSVMTCRGIVDGRGALAGTPIRWHPVPGSRDRDRLDRSCAAVGPAVVAQPDQSVNAPRVRLDDVAIVTWNVHADAGEIATLVAAVRSGAAAEPARPHVVLLLQEAYRAGPLVPARAPASVDVPPAVRTRAGTRMDIVAVARALDMHLVYIPSMRNGREAGPSGPEDRGNAILSTLPLSEIAAIELPMSRHRRVAIAASVSGDGAEGPWRLRLASIHLDTVGSWRNLYLFSSHLRARQARRVIDVLAEGDVAVIGADANSWSEGPNEPAVTLFQRAFPATPAPAWQPTFQRMWRLDYLFFRVPPTWQVGSRRADRAYGSDHHPLIGHITTQ